MAFVPSLSLSLTYTLTYMCTWPIWETLVGRYSHFHHSVLPSFQPIRLLYPKPPVVLPDNWRMSAGLAEQLEAFGKIAESGSISVRRQDMINVKTYKKKIIRKVFSFMGTWRIG